MFHVSLVELTVSCAIVLVLLIVPVMLARARRDIEKRLSAIEKKIGKGTKKG